MITKKAYREGARFILGRHDIEGARGKVTNIFHISFMERIFRNHTEHDMWVRDHGGMKSFEVVNAIHPMQKDKNNVFNITMKDGWVRENVSFLKAIEGEKAKVESVKRAMRWAIMKTHGSGKDGLHLDHAGPMEFVNIFNAYIKAEGYENVLKDVVSMDKGGSVFTNERAKHYMQYHDSVARLELIPAEDNLAKPKNGQCTVSSFEADPVQGTSL